MLLDSLKRSPYTAALESGTVRYTAEMEEQAKAKASNKRGETPNGQKFYTMAQEEERRGDMAKAVGHLRMAMPFEPANEFFKAELERLQPPKKKKKKKKQA